MRCEGLARKRTQRVADLALFVGQQHAVPIFYGRDWMASRAARPANTVASARFDQRPHPGRRANQRLAPVAANTQTESPVMTMTNCVAARTRPCSSTLPRAGSMNWGNSASWNTASFGFSSDVIASVIYKEYQAGFFGLATAGNVVLFIFVTLIVYPLFRYFNSKEVDL